MLKGIMRKERIDFMMKTARLEKLVFILFPVAMATGMIVYGLNSGWDELRVDLMLYLYLAVAVLAVYYLIRKATLVIGRLNISLWKDASFDAMSPAVLTFRFKIGVYAGAIGAAVMFVAGIVMSADLVIIFSWSLLGVMVGSKRLIEGYQRQEF